MAIRMALGAEARDVRPLVIRRGMALALVGICLGLLGAWDASRLLKGLLFGISALNPVGFSDAALFF